MKVIVDMENVSSCTDIPDEIAVTQWVEAALCSYGKPAEVAINVIDEDESAKLNYQYRRKNNPTNILSFPANLPESLELPLLGDLAICAQVVAREAAAQNKDLYAHWAHIVIHGTLHLIGFDHISDAEEKKMELLEIEILASFNLSSPYEQISEEASNL
tara:strand:- start:3 stop:479 length:477 start_codon:yes stop_codon:yes gene_type:complete